MLGRIVPIVVVAFAGGCGGAPGVTWRADSSGFLYTDKGGTRVVAFDLKTKTSRPLVTDAETKTLLPGLSPDGKQVAVARLEYPWKGKPRLQVRIYNSDGKQEKRSSWFDRNDEPDKLDKVGPVSLSWPAGDRIVLFADDLCIYDVAKDRLIEVKNVQPWYPGTSTLRPDGKGCFGWRASGRDDVELVFLDWDGAVRPLGKLGDQKVQGVPFLAGWEGDVALLMLNGVILEADTAKGTLKASLRKLPVIVTEGQLEACHIFPDRLRAVCVYSHQVGAGTSKETRRTVEAQDLVSASRSILLKECNVYPFLHPSPDGKTVVIGYTPYEVKKEPGLLVVGADGKVVSDIKVVGR
jgi:hypothetical protein